MKQETIVRRARDKALKYAEKQHRYRAKTIALDELAEAYNQEPILVSSRLRRKDT